jgi:WD40 repeat protein
MPSTSRASAVLTLLRRSSAVSALGLMLTASCRTVVPARERATLPTSRFLASDTAHIQFAVPSADGRRLAILTTSGVLMAWQLEPRRLLGRWQVPGTPIQNHTNGSPSIAFDAIGEYLAIGTKDGPVRVYQVDPPRMLGAFTPTPASTLHAHPRRASAELAESRLVVDSTHFGQFPVQAVAFTPGRFQLAVASGPGITLWNLQGMIPFDSVEFASEYNSPHHEMVAKVVYEAAGATLLVATADGQLRRYDVRTKRERWRREWGTSPPTALAVSPTGGTIFIAGGVEPRAMFAELDGTIRCRVDADHVATAVFSPDGAQLLIANNRGIVVVNVQRCTTLRVATPSPYLPAGAWFAARCRHAFFASRVSRKIGVFTLPPAFWC